MSDESAELLQLDAALHVTDRGAFEHRHARSAAANCYNLVCLTPLHALHAAHACVSRIVCVASLRAVLQPNVAVTRDAAQAQGRQLPYISLDAKGASSIHTGAAENDDRTHALHRLHVSRHHHVVPTSPSARGLTARSRAAKLAGRT